MTTLVIATRNRHKAEEIQSILGPNFRCLALDAFPGAPSIVENAPTFEGNAAKKALALAEWLRDTRTAERGMRTNEVRFVLADDSGLEVDALGGAPGVHSARFAAEDSPANAAINTPDAANNAKLLRLLRDVSDANRTARFRCDLALVPLTPHSSLLTPHFFSGTCEGRMQFAPTGAGGFGYDPLFVPDGFTQSFAELGGDVKNRISHRSKALAAMRDWFASRASERGG